MAAQVIGSTWIDHPGNPPIAFAIPFDAQTIDGHHRYTVRATISVDGKLMMTTDRAYPMPTQGFGNVVALLLCDWTGWGGDGVTLNGAMERYMSPPASGVSL